MKRPFSSPNLIALLLAASAALFFGAGCSAKNPYVGPTVASVGVTGSYSDHDGNTYGGGVQVGLNPPPTPTPKPSKYAK